MDSVQILCPSCGVSVPPGMKFCGHCGARLAESRSAGREPASVAAVMPEAREDRRLVSVLFCDLVGFTQLTESSDIEELRELQDEYFARMSAEVERFGGTVEKYAGDAVLAVFGSPVVHEDDAERAVRCALAMQTSLKLFSQNLATRRIELGLRVGINTGEVVTGIREAGGRRDYAVTGDAVNTAARFQSAAEAGGIIVGELTMELARRGVEFGERRMLSLKGKSEPVGAYPALHLRHRPIERWEQAEHRSPLVGREAELTELMDAWDSLQAGQAQIRVLSGDPGVGKSRLLAEFLVGVPEDRFTTCRCLAHEEHVSLALVTQLARALLKIPSEVDQHEAHLRLSDAVDRVFATKSRDQKSIAIDVLGEVLGLEMPASFLSKASPQVRREALTHALTTMLVAAVSDGFVLALEDVHWIDASSQDLLSDLLRSVKDQPVLVLLTRRPEGKVSWEDWENARSIRLSTLGRHESLALASNLLGARLDGELLEQLDQRAGGNPFFMEELLVALQLAGALVERDGVVSVAPGMAERLPATLTELVLARLDQLEEPVRRLSQVGSVIGREFAVKVLSLVVDQEATALAPQLERLEELSIAYERWDEELKYAFKHAVIRDVAYSTLITKRRRRLHALVARALADHFPGNEAVEIIAHHFKESDEQEPAAVWLERAGDRAASVYANETAVAHYRAAIDRLERLEGKRDQLGSVAEKLGAALALLGRFDEALEALETARSSRREDVEAAGRLTAALGLVHQGRATPQVGLEIVDNFLQVHAGGNVASLGYVIAARARLLSSLGKYRESLLAAKEAAERAREQSDRKLLIRAETARANAELDLGDFKEAVHTLEKVVGLAETEGDVSLLAQSLAQLGGAHEDSGDADRALQYFHKALDLARRLGSSARTAGMLVNLARVHYRMAEWDESDAEISEALAILRGAGRSAALGMALYSKGAQDMFRGRWDEADRNMNEARVLAESAGSIALMRFVTGFEVQGLILRGHADEAIKIANRVMDEEGAESDVTWLLPVMAWAQSECGQLGKGKRTAEEAVERAEASGYQIALVDALWVAGRIASEKGRHEAAKAYLDRGLALTRQTAFRWGEIRTGFEYGLMLQRAGKDQAAEDWLRRSLQEFRRLQAQPYVELAEEALASLNV